jgi:glycosyltransferase involved in cell wall biosynthesis
MNDKPLRILEVITPSHYSGAERVVTYLSDELRRQGHEVLVLSKPLPPLEEALAARGVPYQTLPLSGKFNWSVGRLLREAMRSFRPDVVNCHLSTATRWSTWAARREGIPCVAHVHGMTQPLWYRRADLLIGPSVGVREYLVSMGFPAERIEVVYNGLDPASFENLPPPEPLREELGLPPGAPVVGLVAHLSPKKGHRVLLEAMAQLTPKYPTLQLLAIGREGTARRRQRLLDLAGRLGLSERVHLLGYRADAAALTQLFDVAVLPSVLKEGLGLVLLEAAFLGIPAAGSDARGISEAVENGVTGLLSPPGEVEGLAAALDRLLGDPELRRQMGEAARLRAREKFTLQVQAEATVAVFRRLMERF